MSEALPDGTAAFFRAPQAFLLAQAIEAGDAARFGLGGAPIALVASPALARQVLSSSAPELRKGWLYDVPRTASGDGLATMENAAWRPQRALHAPHVARLASRNMAGPIVAARMPRWTEAARSGLPFDPFSEGRSVTFEVVLGGLFGITPSACSARLSEAVDEVGRTEHVTLDRVLARLGTTRPMLDMFKASGHHVALGRVDDLVAELLEPFVAGEVEDAGLLGAALAMPEMDRAPPAARRRFARDTLLTGIMAGSFSTGDSIGWALCLLARHEAVADRLAHAAGDATAPGLLSDVIDETLRLYPPIWFAGRVAAEAVEFGGVAFEAGTAILCSPYVLHRLPRFWDRPDVFDPARFASAGRVRSEAFLPFGVGPRACIGQSVARATMAEVLGAIVTRFHLLPPENAMPEPGGAFSLSPRHRTTIRLRPRGPHERG